MTRTSKVCAAMSTLAVLALAVNSAGAGTVSIQNATKVYLPKVSPPKVNPQLWPSKVSTPTMGKAGAYTPNALGDGSVRFGK